VRTYLELYNIKDMDYSLDDFYEYNDHDQVNKDYVESVLDGGLYNMNTKDRAKEILIQLESDDELLRDFNLLLRQKKLEQIKKK